MVPGGLYNGARGIASFAAGNNAEASDQHPYSFVWSGSMYGADSEAAHSVTMRAPGGFWLYREQTGGAFVRFKDGDAGWVYSSDRALKRNIAPVDPEQIAQRLDQLEISTWSMKSDPASTAHIGPMAQDFSRVFSVGADDTTIGTGDGIGVALAGAQAAYRIAVDQRLQMHRLREDSHTLAQENVRLRSRIDRLEEAMAALVARCP
jgi:hypothetical protein